ncbi:hypothetical protein WJM97_01210 [Okeanomitos corallinicola TIOX110]|uniref:Molecular chaperone n=1 Tax=Okeanomitos corallinicola TIOX110 TaxID=3133117 RepID=A0ABZ2UVF4_9CYAN
MTFNKDEINKLIADIDQLLVNSSNPLSKLLSGQGEDDKNVLQRVRAFLVSIDQSETPEPIPEVTNPEQSQTPPLSSLITRYVEQEQNKTVADNYLQEQLNLNIEQLKEQISVIIQPLQTEVSGLLEERTALVQEIRQLEQKRLQNYSLTQQLANQEQIINEFIQVLTNRLVPNLIPYLSQNAPSSSGLINRENSQEVNISSNIQSVLESTQGLEKLNVLARDLDQRLLSLDGTVNVVFQALERNINTYYQSLSQALTRMHSQEMQGEQLMTNFLNNLRQYLQEHSPDAPPFVFGVDVGTEEKTVAPSAEEVVSQQTTKIPESDIVADLDTVLSELTVEESSLVVEENLTQADESQSHVQEELILEPTNEIKTTEIFEDLDTVLSELTVEESSLVVEENLTQADESQSYVQEELILEPTDEIKTTEIVEDLDTVLSQLYSPEPLTTVAEDLQVSVTEELISDLATDTQEPEIIENLDILLSQLTTQRPSDPVTANFTSPNEPEVENIDIDEVDELYASLFGGTDAVSSSAETTVAVTNEVSTAVPAESIPLSETQQPEVNLLVTSESSIPENTTELVAVTEQVDLWEEPLLPEDTQSQAEFASTPKLMDSHPDSSDTITVLTDLLVEFNDTEQVTEVLPSQEEVKPKILENPVVTSSEEESMRATDLTRPGYITASPQENLLSLENENGETEGIPNIVLDEAQLQQLDQDLASFDGRLNSQSEQITNLQSSQDFVDDNTQSEQITNLQSSQDFVDDNTRSEQITNLQIPQGFVYGSAEIENVEMVMADSSPTNENVPLAAVADLYVDETEKTTGGENFISESAVPVSEDLEGNSSDNANLGVINPHSVWYLGIDLGTTGISAALLDRSQLVVYPIYWSAENKSGEISFDQSFRLPAEVYLPTASVPNSAIDKENPEQTTPAVVAQDNNISKSAPKQNLYSTHLKPFLQVAIPYKNSQQKWEPVLQLNEFSAGPLIWVLRSLSKLLLTLKSDQISTTPALIAHGAGIDNETFLTIINNLAGVICTCPSSWSEQYRFNVREAILTSQLVSHAQQIFFVEEAIATLLPELDFGHSQFVQLNNGEGLQPLKTNPESCIGSTLTLNVGAAATEMALVDLPTDLSELTHKDFMLHGFSYGGKAIEQDIICQLLLPPKSRQPRGTTQNGSQATTNHPQSWQPSIPGLDQIKWSSLSLEGLELPRVGEPDVTARIRLQQRLESSLLGQGLLDAALALKLILQHQESFTLEIADQRWLLQRRDLETQIFVPYVRRLNREVNKLLVARGVPTEAINQAILSGGVASISTVNRWLRQKLPNAKIVQDLYLGSNGAPNCSRVAYGLTMLPLYPQVLEIARQQYTDYFLFNELLKILSDNLRGETTRSLSFGEVLQLFESRGINTRICQQRLLAFLEGELPAGLVPVFISEGATETQADQSLYSIWLTKKSQENPDYQAIASTSLFEKQGNLSYRPNLQQLILLRRYLDAIKDSALQSLEEPLAVNFAVAANS